MPLNSISKQINGKPNKIACLFCTFSILSIIWTSNRGFIIIGWFGMRYLMWEWDRVSFFLTFRLINTVQLQHPIQERMFLNKTLSTEQSSIIHHPSFKKNVAFAIYKCYCVFFSSLYHATTHQIQSYTSKGSIKFCYWEE